jgi:hypothetical protein
VYHDITHREIKTGTEFDDLAEAELMDWLRQVSVVNCLLIASSDDLAEAELVDWLRQVSGPDDP